jgi:hypothetical protein
MAQVHEWVQMDQADNFCWTLPQTFWTVEPKIM